MNSGSRAFTGSFGIEGMLRIQFSGTLIPHTEQVHTSQSGVTCENSGGTAGAAPPNRPRKCDKLRIRSGRGELRLTTRGMEPEQLMAAEQGPVGAAPGNPPHRRGLPAVGAAIVYAALVAVLLERMTAVACDLQLWADGAWFLVRVASTRHYYFWARIFTILAEQTPLVLATYLPVHSLHALSLALGSRFIRTHSSASISVIATARGAGTCCFRY